MHRKVPLIAVLLAAAPAAAQTPAAPPTTPKPTETCRADSLFRSQDFTLGHWDVFNGEKKTAEVTMTLILNDCVIEERWMVLDTARGGNGVGLFNYSPLLKNWGYYWATDTGATTSFRGGLIKPGEMRYVTERPLPNGKVRLRHWTLVANPDGTIRELSMGTEDGGATWITEYDLAWVRHK